MRIQTESAKCKKGGWKYQKPTPAPLSGANALTFVIPRSDKISVILRRKFIVAETAARHLLLHQIRVRDVKGPINAVLVTRRRLSGLGVFLRDRPGDNDFPFGRQAKIVFRKSFSPARNRSQSF